MMPAELNAILQTRKSVTQPLATKTLHYFIILNNNGSVNFRDIIKSTAKVNCLFFDNKCPAFSEGRLGKAVPRKTKKKMTG
jgi:hypothetical protein